MGTVVVTSAWAVIVATMLTVLAFKSTFRTVIVTSARTFLASHLVVVALAALAGTETLVADVLSALTQVIVSAVKNDELQQFAVQTAVVQGIFHRRLQADFEVLLLVVADEPSVIALEGVLEFEAQVAVELLQILNIQSFAVGRVGNKRTLFRYQFDVVEVAAFQFDVFVESGALDVGACDGNGLALDIAAVDFVCELTLGAVIVVNLVKQVGVVVGPLLEGVMVAIDTWSDVGTNQCCLDEEGARATHGVNQVGVTLPAAKQDNASCQYLVDGGIGLCHTPSALKQRVTAAVERQCHVAPRDVDIETDFGIGEADTGTLAVFLVEEIGDGILDTISDKA